VKYKKYPQYKDSGVEWLEETPEHWENYRIDWTSTLVRGNTGFKKDELKENGEYVALQYGKTYKVNEVNETFKFYVDSEFYKSSQVAHYGDTILISTSETIEDLGHSCFYNREDLGLIGGEQILLKPNTELVFGKYLYYYSKVFCNQLSKYATGLKVFRFNIDDLKNIFIPISPLQEQQTIANYLDRATAKIDTLIEKQTKLIEILKEKRQAVISTAVTRGLDSSVPMKDSGVEWLGKIPEHWEVVQSRRIFQERKGRAIKNDEQLTASQKYGVIPQKLFMEMEGRKVTQVLTGSEILKHIEVDDFVISMRSFQGGLEYSTYTGCVSSAYVGIIPIKHIHSNFFKYLFKSKSYIQALQSTSNLVRDGQALRFENFSKVSLVIIPLEEQQTIADSLDDKTSKIDTLVTKATKAIELLKERRTVLISAIVTGKIDVREES